MTTSIENVFAAIRAERLYQDEKWGPLKDQNGRDSVAWVNTIREELDEAENEDFRGADDDFYLELVQVAAVAVAALQQLGPKDIEECMKRHRGQV